MIKDANNKLNVFDIPVSVIIVVLTMLLVAGIGILLNGALGASNLTF